MRQEGTLNELMLTQSGYDHLAKVTQHANDALVSQAGYGNAAYINQNGTNSALVTQH